MADIYVYSANKNDDLWSTIVHFTSTDNDCCDIGDRIPAIFYNNNGYLLIDSTFDGKGNHSVTYNIDMEKDYHIEIDQRKEKKGVRK